MIERMMASRLPGRRPGSSGDAAVDPHADDSTGPKRRRRQAMPLELAMAILSYKKRARSMGASDEEGSGLVGSLPWSPVPLLFDLAESSSSGVCHVGASDDASTSICVGIAGAVASSSEEARHIAAGTPQETTRFLTAGIPDLDDLLVPSEDARHTAAGTPQETTRFLTAGIPDLDDLLVPPRVTTTVRMPFAIAIALVSLANGSNRWAANCGA